MGIICTNISKQNICFCLKEKERRKKKGTKITEEKEKEEKEKEEKEKKEKEEKEKKEKEEKEKKERKKRIRLQNKDLLSNELKDKLKKFINEDEYQRDFYSNTDDNDSPFNNLKNKEEGILLKEFKEIKKNYSQNLNNRIKNIFQTDNKDNENELISKTIENEKTEIIYQYKIINQITSIKENDSNFEIEHLTILLVGRKSVGKTTLIEYILNSKLNNEEEITKISDKNCTIYEKKNHYLKLIEFKSFDLSEKPEEIGKKIDAYIKGLAKSQNTNYNDYVHSIWYCLSDARLEESEDEIIKNLIKVYKDNIMPIIFVYLQAIDENTANEMKDYINENYKNSNFVNVLAKDINKHKAYGDKELLKKTMGRCTKALQGEMIKLMTQKISEDVKQFMIKKNEDNRIKINKCIIDEFIKNYKTVKNDNDFIEYIIDILKNNLLIFYENYMESISNETLYLLEYSELINEVKECISIYKNELKEKIKSKVEEKAKDFICFQADEEKNSDNMSIDHKRRLKGFEKTTRKYFEQNYYFICQKYIISEIIQKFMAEYVKRISDEIDYIIIDLLDNKNKEKEIQSQLEDCFKKKLKNFANNKAKIPFEEKKLSDIKTAGETPGEFDNEIQEIKLDTESYTPNNALSKIKNKKNEILSISDEKDEELEIKYNIDDSSKEFWQKYIIQDTYFHQKTQDDQVFNILKNHIKFDLLNYIYSNKDLINKYKHKTMIYDKSPISKIIGSQDTSKIYKEKIKNEFKKIEENDESFRIEYLSIIVIGKSGVGKSTLINCMLKEKLSKEGIGDRITTENSLYYNKKIPFLRLIDTVGIELNPEYTPKKILEDTLKYIRDEKSKENQDYNNYIYCIWYCVKDNVIEDKEIEIINNLKNEMSNLPLIVINTFKIEKEENSLLKQKILENCPNIKFTQLLARSTDKDCLSYGLDDLLDITLNSYNNALNGDIFNKMGEKISKTIENNFLCQNKKIKENINIKIIPEFLNYEKSKRNDEYKEYILNFLEKIFLEFLKLNKEEKEELSFNNKYQIQNFKNVQANIDQYINFYVKEIKKLVEPKLYGKAIEYLDFQVGIEKKEKISIKRENKYNKNNFEEFINKFLNNNFNFIAQKNYLNYIKRDISEGLIKDIGDEIIKIVKILLKNESEDLFRNIYRKKFKDFKNWINNNYRKNNKNIYNNLSNSSIFQDNINGSNNKKGGNNTSLNQKSERSAKINNKKISITNTPEIKKSYNTFYDKKSENNTPIDNKSEKSENKNNNSILKKTPGEKIRASLYKGNEKAEESDNNDCKIKGPEINI